MPKTLPCRLIPVFSSIVPIYDNFAPYYDRFFSPLESAGLARWRKEALGLLPDAGSVLEIGCGTGANFEYYPAKWNAVSTEISIEMIIRAGPKRVRNVIICAAAESLPFSANSFDAAFATLVFCSVKEPQTALGELRRVIRPGGDLVLLEHVRPPGLLGKGFDVLSIATERLFEDHFNRETAALAISAGFESVSLSRHLFGIVEIMHFKTPL